MLTLYNFFKHMDLDCELEVFGDLSEKALVAGKRGTVDLPDYLYDAEITKFIPGIVTMIFIKEPRF